MTSQELGSSFEKITLDFFLFLFKQLKIQVNNNWVQKAGYQYGFDVGFEVAILNDDFFKRGVYIECKNYEKSILEQAQLHTKLLQFDRSDYEKKNSIFIFLSPKIDLSKCTQDSNPKQLEDYFNRTSQFKTIILTPNNNIRDILSLNEQIFCKVYSEVFTELDDVSKGSILEYFQKLLFSKGEIPNFKLSQKRKEYLEQASISKSKIYISRKLKTNKFSFSFQDKNLLDVIKTKNLVLLLGEPGSGKTTELINISKYFEKNILKLEITPIFVSLSSIKKFDTLDDILPTDWILNKKIVLLLDALDEFEFKNELGKVVENLLKYNDISFKIIISCRTYAYNDELKSLEAAVFYLDNFNSDQSFELLNKKYNIPLSKFNKISSSNFKDILQDPFMLNRFGKYYENHKKLPVALSSIYDDIKDELAQDDLEVYKILSLVLELTKQTSVDKKQLKDLFGIKYKKLAKLSLIENSFDKSSFKFIHKNYQEYFAAAAISELSFEQILSFISIQGIEKTHPTLFNTITFLINILEDDKYNSLIEWLTINNPELLIKADKSRTANFRVKVFQDYFKSECVEKTFWISSGTFSIKEIAEFGDCEDNFDFLVSFITDPNNHFRAVISALELLSYFTIPEYKKENLKTLFFNFLTNPEHSEMIKSHILDCIADQKLCDEDPKYLNNIFKLFKQETNKQLNRSLLSLIEYHKEIDTFFWFIKMEFLLEKGYNQREVKDEVIRGTSWVLEELILRLEKSSHFITLAKYYFDDEKDDYSSNDFIEKLINRCLYFEEREKSFLTELLSSLLDTTKFYLREDALKTLLLKLKPGSQLEAFDCLISRFSFDRVGYFLASITNENTIELIINKFSDGSVEGANLDYYRNMMANHGKRSLSEHFNNTMLEKGFKFNEPFLTDKEHDELVAKFKGLPQQNFDLLFHKSELISRIKSLFEEHGSSISSEMIRKIETDWYRKNGHANKGDIAISLLRRLIHQQNTEVKFEDVEHLLEDEATLINEMKSQISALNDTHNNFVISNEQQNRLNQWCQKASNEIRFDRILRYVTADRYGALEDYAKLKTVLFFLMKFNFDLPKEFLLNCIEFVDVNNSNEGDNKLEWLKRKINNDLIFNQRIIDNINTKNLVFLPLNIHIQYALDNNLSAAFSKIKEHFLMPDYNYNIEKKLELYVNLTKDVELLKKLCQDVTSHKCWSSLKILMDLKIEQNFCQQKAAEYLETEILDEKNYYSSTALSILFELNSISAVKYVSSFLNKNKLPSLSQTCYANYYAVEDFNILKTLFDKIYRGDSEEIGFSGLGNFIFAYVSNLSKSKKNYDSVQAELLNIKLWAKEQNLDNELFHINQLIDKSKNSYINAQSKALNFNEALQKVEQILK
ncbi:NACHT domain-containing protein [Pseudomonas shirazensis]